MTSTQLGALGRAEALSFGFSKGLSRPLLICGALDDAVPLPAPLRCGNHMITAESASVRCSAWEHLDGDRIGESLVFLGQFQETKDVEIC